MKTEKIIKKNGISFRLDENTHTAMIINSSNECSNVIIPTSIFHETHQYIVTIIGKDSFKDNKTVKTIQFEDNSKLIKIEQNSFFCSSLQSLSIPSSVIELEEGWCNHTWNLTHINISKDNKKFSFLDKESKIIIGKTEKTEKNFNVIIFACRNIKHVTIPSTIKHISSFAFSECLNLKKIEISEDSNLLTIGKESLARSSIESFYIPSKLIELGDSWCSFTNFLESIVISKNNKNFVFIDDDHKLIAGKTKPKKKNYNILLFACRDIKQAVIPSTIKYISPFAFCGCRKLEKVQFYNDSKLKIIDKSAFSNSALQSILIPANVTKIKERAFCKCDNLSVVEFSKHSKLKKIEKKSFFYSSIQKISIPSTTEVLENEWCASTPNLTKVKVSKNNKNFKFIDNEKKIIVGKTKQNKDNFDVLVFACRNIISAFIPSQIKHINSFAFCNCDMLETIEFAEDSELQTIGKKAFSYSSIKQILIPSKVIRINENAFSFCGFLKNIQFHENSNLLSFDKNIFVSSSIESIFIPSKIEEIDEEWCCNAPNLMNIKISEKNKNFSFIDNEQKIIVGRSKQDENCFDTIVFACRDIENAFIPSTIKQINSYAFSNCSHLKHIEFSSNSNILTINENAFSHSSIEFISIPKSVTKIGKSAFSFCAKLESIQFDNASNLSTFENNLLFRSSIKDLEIPSNVEILNDGWCNCTEKLCNISISQKNNQFTFLENERIIVGKSEPSQNCFDIIEFACRDISQILIPSTIKKISPFAFFECFNLNKVEFSDDSKLVSIGNNAFAFSNVYGIKIPKKVENINEKAFQGCLKLISIEFLGENLTINCFCFCKCPCLSVASFPNSHIVFINNDAFVYIPKYFSLFICADAIIMS